MIAAGLKVVGSSSRSTEGGERMRNPAVIHFIDVFERGFSPGPAVSVRPAEAEGAKTVKASVFKHH